MKTRRTLLLDHHGVISDGERLPAEWRRLLGEFLTPRFGSAPDVWAEANRAALARSFERLRGHRTETAQQEEQFIRSDRTEWMRDMLVFAKVAVPDDEALHTAAVEAQRYVTLHAHAEIPGAAEALRELHRRGMRLFTSSGDRAENVSNYLTALGVRDLFTQTYGADLLGVAKDGPEFFVALLAHASLDPGDVTVVDDDAFRLDWARGLGMATVLVGPKDPSAAHARIARLVDLPAMLA